MIAHPIPVLTADYDLWVHADDIEALNAAFDELDFAPTCLPGDARRCGRHVLEDGHHIDVLVARSQSTKDGSIRLHFEDAWARRISMPHAPGVSFEVACIDDLMTTKRWSMRDKDVADFHLLQSLKEDGGGR